MFLFVGEMVADLLAEEVLDVGKLLGGVRRPLPTEELVGTFHCAGEYFMVRPRRSDHL